MNCRSGVRRGFKPQDQALFDLIVVDECPRGNAAEDSAWREILDYFKSATQIGMTATATETKYISNINYFGEPTYSYSLKQGIRDGFLAPYKGSRSTSMAISRAIGPPRTPSVTS